MVKSAVRSQKDDERIEEKTNFELIMRPSKIDNISDINKIKSNKL